MVAVRNAGGPHGRGAFRETSGEVAICFPIDDVADGRCPKTVSSRERCASLAICICPSDVRHDFLAQFPHVLLWAGDVPAPPFLVTVPHIVSDGPQEEMAWSYARWIVALVERPESIGNRSEGQLPRRPTRSDVVPVIPERPVSSIIDSSGPHPAIAKRFLNDGAIFVYLRPKAFLRRFHIRSVGALDAAKLASAVTNLIGYGQEVSRTHLADSWNAALVYHYDPPSLPLIVQPSEGVYGFH